MSMITPYYIYRHIRPDTNQVFYIGKGKNRRNSYTYERAHDTISRNQYWENIVNKNNGIYDIEIVMEFYSPEVCVEKEKELIALYGRADKKLGTLSNLTDGGDGSWGLIVSQELRRKRSELMSGEKHPNWGKKLSEETCRKKSEAIKGERHYLYGKKLPESWKNNIRKSKYGFDNPMFSRYGALHPKSKQVVDTKTGTIYESIREAAIAFNLTPSILYQYLDGTRRNKTTLAKVA